MKSGGLMKRMSVRQVLLLVLCLALVAVLQSWLAPAASAQGQPPAPQPISNELSMTFQVGQASAPPTTSSPVSSAPTEEISIVVDAGDGQQVATAKIQRTTQPDGTKRDKVALTADQAKQAVARAVQSGQKTARIVIPDQKDEVAQLDIAIPREATAELATGGLDLEIYTDNAKLVLRNQSLAEIAEDFYFRIIPIKKETERVQVEERARVEQAVKLVAGENQVKVVARPMTIQTNLSSRAVDIVLPLLHVALPEEEQARDAFLASLAIFIEHSDGERRVVKPDLVQYKDGLLGLQFEVSKFSTFTILNIEGRGAQSEEQGATGHQAYIQGYPDATFRPDQSISRAEMAMILYRIDAGAASDDVKTRRFSDIASTHWAFDAIHEASARAWMQGLPDGSFAPGQPITRAEMAVVVSRWSGLQGGEAAGFADTAGHWAEQDIARVHAAGLLQGYPDGTFRPQQALTRAEAVTLINSMLERDDKTWTRSSWSDVPTTHWAFQDIEEASVDHE